MRKISSCLITIILLALFSTNCIALKQPNIKKIIPEFHVYAQKYMRITNTPGMAIGIVHNNKVIYAKGFGVRKIGDKAKVETNTIFQIGSISKSFTTALMAMLIDEKKVKWDDRVITYLPKFRMYDPWVTKEYRIEDLFAQYSGLKSHAGDFQVMLSDSRDEIIRDLRHIKPVTSFRLRYAYQNSLFLVAAAIEQAITKQSWEKLLQQKIFTPLEMRSSNASLTDYLNTSNKAWLHHSVFGKTIAYRQDWPFLDWPYIYGPAGGINSNIADMTKWLIMQMSNGKYKGKQLISKANVKLMHQPHIFGAKFLGADEYYALSWVYRPYSPYPIIWHNGETSGAHNMIAFIPQLRIGIVILTNTSGNGRFPEALAFQFFDKYLGKLDKDWVKLAVAQQKQNEAQQKLTKKTKTVYSPPSLKPYLGKYHNPIYGDVIVTQKEKNLLATVMGARLVKFLLRPYKSNVFSLYCDDMDLYGETEATFQTDQTELAKTMTIQFLGQDSDEKFIRVK